MTPIETGPGALELVAALGLLGLGGPILTPLVAFGGFAAFALL